MEEILMVGALGGINDELEDLILNNILQGNNAMQRNRAEQYGRLNLDQLTEEEALLYFRFKKEDLMRLTAALRIPNIIRTGDRHTASGLEGLCIYLRRLAYPNRLSDLEPLFGLSAQSISDISNTVMHFIHDNYSYILRNLNNLRWLNCNNMHRLLHKGTPLNNCWAFIDGTARAICRPSVDQENYYSGHKRHHCVEYQSVLCPDGIVANLTSAYPGRRHDAGIFRESNLYAQLEECTTFPNGETFVLYGDQAYGVRGWYYVPTGTDTSLKSSKCSIT